MKAKTKFFKMYNKLPDRAKTELVYDFTINPMTLKVIANEIKYNTNFGKEILKRLGYEDDKPSRTGT